MENNEHGKDLIQRRQMQILAAAKKVFAAKGYRLTKTDDIAAEIGVGKGTLYRYFFDKRRLFLAVYDEGLRQLDQLMEEQVFTVTDPVEYVETGARVFFEFFDVDRDLIEIMMQVRSEFKEEYRESFMSIHGKYSIRLEEVLRRGVDEGILRQMDVGRTAKAMSDLLVGTFQSFYYSQSQERLLDSYDAVCGLLLNGIVKRA